MLWKSLKGKILSSLGFGVGGAAMWFGDNRVYAGTPGIWGLACSEQYSSQTKLILTNLYIVS